MPMLRCVYVDLDGTLLGPGASLVRGADGGFSLLGVRALEACHRAEVEVVFYSGRRRAQLSEDARLLGCSAYAFEAGAGLMLDGELEWLTGELRPGARTINEQIEDSGAPTLLLERYAGRLEYHDPFHREREVSHLFRGLVDVEEAQEALAAAGIENLRLIDNGVARTRSPALAELPIVRVYHLVPAGVSKTRAVARHMQARGLRAAETIAVGDSREDLACAEVVGRFWLVANALARDAELAGDIAGRANVRVAEAAYGAGVYEAVVTTLAEGRG